MSLAPHKTRTRRDRPIGLQVETVWDKRAEWSNRGVKILVKGELPGT